MLKKSLTVTLLFLLMTVGNPTEAGWKTTAWKFLKEVARDTAIDVVQSFFKDDVKPKEMRILKAKVFDLERQLYSIREGGYNPPDFGSVEQTILRLTKIVNAMESRLSSLEDRVTALETRVTVLEHIPFVQHAIVRWEGNSKSITSTSTVVYSDNNTYHIGDENFRSKRRWTYLLGECYNASFNVPFSANTLVIKLKTYGTEAHNLIYVNGNILATLPPQGLRKPNKWTGYRKVSIILDELISGYNELKICAIPITFAPEFAGDKDDFQIKNLQIMIKR